MKKIGKALAAVSIAVSTFMFKANMIFATNVENILGGADEKTDVDGAVSQVDKTVTYYGQSFVTIAIKVGVFIAVFFAVVLGVKFMANANNAQKTSESKAAVLPFVVGAIIAGGATAIVTWLFGIGNEITRTGMAVPFNYLA